MGDGYGPQEVDPNTPPAEMGEEPVVDPTGDQPGGEPAVEPADKPEQDPNAPKYPD